VTVTRDSNAPRVSAEGRGGGARKRGSNAQARLRVSNSTYVFAPRPPSSTPNHGHRMMDFRPAGQEQTTDFSVALRGCKGQRRENAGVQIAVAAPSHVLAHHVHVVVCNGLDQRRRYLALHAVGACVRACACE